jgi:anti-sigma-K factor RskA
VVAAVAAVAAAVLAVSGVLLATRDDPAGRRVELAGAGVTGWAVLAADTEGTRIDLEVSGLEAGHAYGVWLEDARGARVPAGSFRPAPDGETHLVLNAGLPLDQSRAIGVTRLGGDDMVRRDLAGPTSAPG